MSSGQRAPQRLLLLALAAAPHALAQGCAAPGTYSYGSSACAPCTAGAAFVSAAAGCSPAYGAADTAFYLSGAQDEGAAAFSANATPAFTLGPFNTANGALLLSAAGPSLLSAAPGAAGVLAGLPTGAGAWTAAALVKCAPPAGRAGVLEWGAADDALGALAPQAAAVVVAGAASAVGNAVVARVCDSTWHHVAVVNKPGISVSTFVDGALQSALPIGAATGYSAGTTELARCRSIVAGMQPFIWLDPANAVADGAGTLTTWNNAPEATCTGACVTLSPTLAATNATGVPTVGLGKPLVTSVMPTLSSSVALFGGAPAVSFTATVPVGTTLATGSFANLAPLPSNLTVTATNSASTSNPTLPCMKFPLLISYVVVFPPNPLFPAVASPFNTTDQGRVLGGTFNNQIFGFWSNKLAATYSDNKGGPANASAAQGWLPAATGAIVKNTPYLFTFYCTAARVCRMWHQGALIANNVVAPVGWANALTINQPLNSCCRFEMSSFQLGDLIATAGVAYTDAQLGALNQYMNLKYSIGLDKTVAGIGGLGYNYMPDIQIPPSGTLRVGWSGNLSAPSAFAGALAELRLYSRALAAAELVPLAQPPILTFPNTVVSPAVPTLGTTVYAFLCAAPATGNGGTLLKSASDNSWGWASGAVPNCVLPSPTPSPTGSTSFSATASPSPSVTPTHSSTSTSSLTATPSTTPSISATPTSSATPSQSSTPSNTPTPSQTPSPTSVPNVQVAFSFTIVASSTVLRPSDIVRAPSVLLAISTSYANILSVSPATVFVRNITDIATNQVTVVSRRLGGSPGSAGVRVDVQVDLGKTPTEGATDAMIAVLSSPAAAQPLKDVIASVSAATGVAASVYSASVVASSVRLVNSPFLAAAPGAGSSSGGGSAGGGGGAVAGGIIGALALACAIWSYRSYSKHGKLVSTSPLLLLPDCLLCTPL